MPATYDMHKQTKPAGFNSRQTSNRREIVKRVDFSQQALTAAQTALVAKIPPGFVFERADAVLRKAQGAASTINVGTPTAATGFLNGANLNGSVDAACAVGGAGSISAGTFFAAPTEVWVQFGSGTVSAGIVDIVLSGYMLRPSL